MKTLGPAPAAVSAGVRDLHPGRRRVLEVLAEASVPLTARQVADRLRVHDNTARDHLEQLVETGHVTRGRRPVVGRGRPAHLYAAVADDARPGAHRSEYAALATALAGQIARTSTDPLGDALAAGETWGRDIAGNRRASSPRQARRWVLELLSDLGFDPTADSRIATIRLRRCPLLEAARARPDVVCPVHLGLVRGLLAEVGGNPADSHLRSFAEPGACRLELSTRPPATRGASPS